MVRLVGFLCLSLVLYCSSCTETREDKIVKYLNSINLDGDVSIGILNPDHCGSCTDYSIDWLSRKNKNHQRKVILTTGVLKTDHKNMLSNNGYSFITVETEKIARVGILLAACTYIEMKSGDLIHMETVK